MPIKNIKTKKPKKTGRPSKYKKIFATKKLEEYLATCVDVERDVVVQENADKGYKMFKKILDVKLPMVEGYAAYLGFTARALEKWAKTFPDFSIALERIKSLQKERLIKYGLEGRYNATIARLILSTNHGMHESSDLTSKGEALTPFNDEQIGKIADRITKRRATNGDPVSK